MKPVSPLRFLALSAWLLTGLVGCSESTVPEQLTPEGIAGRYELESIDGKSLPVSIGSFIGFQWVELDPIVGGYLEIDSPVTGGWRSVIRLRTRTPPITEYDAPMRAGPLVTVDSYGRMTLLQYSIGTRADTVTFDAQHDGSDVVDTYWIDGRHRFRRTP